MILAVVMAVDLEVFDHTFCSDQDGDGRGFDICFNDVDCHNNSNNFYWQLCKHRGVHRG